MKITFELDTEEEPNLAKGILALPDISVELEELGQHQNKDGVGEQREVAQRGADEERHHNSGQQQKREHGEQVLSLFLRSGRVQLVVER